MVSYPTYLAACLWGHPGQLEIDHGGRIYTTEIGRQYESGVFVLIFEEQVIKPLLAHTVDSAFMELIAWLEESCIR